MKLTRERLEEITILLKCAEHGWHKLPAEMMLELIAHAKETIADSEAANVGLRAVSGHELGIFDKLKAPSVPSRAEIAMHAMAALLSNSEVTVWHNLSTPAALTPSFTDDITKASVFYADALLKQLNKTP